MQLSFASIFSQENIYRQKHVVECEVWGRNGGEEHHFKNAVDEKCENGTSGNLSLPCLHSSMEDMLPAKIFVHFCFLIIFNVIGFTYQIEKIHLYKNGFHTNNTELSHELHMNKIARAHTQIIKKKRTFLLYLIWRGSVPPPVHIACLYQILPPTTLILNFVKSTTSSRIHTSY